MDKEYFTSIVTGLKAVADMEEEYDEQINTAHSDNYWSVITDFMNDRFTPEQRDLIDEWVFCKNQTFDVDELYRRIRETERSYS